MKKVLCILLSVIFMMSLAACAGGDSSSSSSSDAATTAANAATTAAGDATTEGSDGETTTAAGNAGGEKITVGYAQVGAESDWRTANTDSFKSTFTEENGYTFYFDDAQQKQDNQVKAIRTFISQEVDYIVLAPTTETGWETVLTEAKDAGIPVILSDRMIDVSNDSLYECWVGGNFVEEGQKGIQWLNDYLKEKGRENEEMNIVLLQGTIGSSAQIGRTQGITEGIEANPKYTLLEKQTGEFTQAKGQEVMESFLKAHDDIDVVFAENDNMAFGAIDAIKAVGKKPGEDIIIVSFDAVKAALEKVVAGEINCSVECNPLHGPRVDEIIKKLENNETVEKIQYVDEGLFDIKNAEQALPDRKY